MIEFDDDASRVDVDAVWDYLAHEAYWGRRRDRSTFEAQLAAAWRVVGCYDDGRQIGFARAVSDGASLAYLADVFVLASHRGRGLGRQLVAAMIDDGPGREFRWLLHTSDGHGLYQRFGFRAPDTMLLERPATFAPKDGWDARVDAVWAGARDRDEAEVVADIDALVAQRPDDDPAALFESASARDFAGREAEAEPLYRAALAGDLDPVRRPQAVIQLASTLRNLGRAADAVAVLDTSVIGHADAATAFRALALTDLGRSREAVVELLGALASHLPAYAGAVRFYAGDLGPAVTLRAVRDDADLDDLVTAAQADADPDDVTPPLGAGWTAERLDWLRTYHRDRVDGLASSSAEVAWAVLVDGQVRGGARLRHLGDGRYETGLWLVRAARRAGLGRAVITAVAELARPLGARELVADTTPANPAAIALLRRSGFAVTESAAGVRGVLSVAQNGGGSCSGGSLSAGRGRGRRFWCRCGRWGSARW